MHKDFFEIINEIYEIINGSVDIIYKFTAINKYKYELNIGSNGSFGAYYFNSLTSRKEHGAVYTPENIANFILRDTIKAEDIISNPNLKILDPSCGSGNFIIPCYKYLKTLYFENLSEISSKNEIEITEKKIPLHIIQNNLYGFDIDGLALKVLMIDLFNEAGYIYPNNFVKQDFLTSNVLENYDIIIGNPPYVGSKIVDKEYALVLKDKYKELYKDKGDISYCFFGAALDYLKVHGKLSFISSRYFIESPSGVNLRAILKENCKINRIVDFYGIRPFKNTGIDPVIVFAEKESCSYKIEVLKPKIKRESSFCSDLYNEKEENVDRFYINKEDLCDTGWILRNDIERKIINKLNEKCKLSLSDICESYQGIITGCDKAFVVDEQVIKNESLECELIKPWIKSSCIEKNRINRKDKFIIYSDNIENVDQYTNCLKHIEVYKSKLMDRRECKKGLRPWYKLQWGRVQKIFEGEKIVFPFKASNNRFAYDCGSYFSADVYCLILKNTDFYTYDSLINLLNSKLYEYYFKTFAKKLGENLYDYYPNNLMKLRLPVIQQIPENIDEFLYSFFNLSENEIEVIKQYVD